jgi:maltose phosphorylase
MHNFLEHHPWKVIEKGFHPEFNRIAESVFSIGNGRFGQRANFEESYSGDTLLGNYVGGVYYPDKTRVGWWKNGYPEYFAKVLNACNWLPIHIKVGDEIVDLATVSILSFERELDMQNGLLKRSFEIKLNNGAVVNARWSRFISMANDELACIRLKLNVSNFKGKISVRSFLDGNIRNQDANYDEFFWEDVKTKSDQSGALLSMKTRKTGFSVSHQQSTTFHEETVDLIKKEFNDSSSCGELFEWNHTSDKSYEITKYISVVSSLIHSPESHAEILSKNIQTAKSIGFDSLLDEHCKKWKSKWEWSDIVIEGDVAAQQGIRFNIFQLNQTYTGEDARLNIGPKGFTGEKYGGSTYWDTEAYCIPFYLSTSDSHVARNLVLYRYNHLQKAIENAEKLGFSNGAALYPMVTMNGEECHNEWEITFEEIHRNGAIAHGIYDYVRYTNDKQYLVDFGLEVLIAIARFWAQRFTWSEKKKAFVMLGVTGPNEYENNVNNNWYTNYIARWCIKYALESIDESNKLDSTKTENLLRSINFKREEVDQWNKIANNIYFPKDQELDLYLQQDGFLDKVIAPIDAIDPSQRPLVDHWSWDRILRSCYIKQADVLQGMYFFEDDFDVETIRKHYEFYEPLTVHESSLSPCIHSIIAAKIGLPEKAYEFYLRTARLDLDDYNHDTKDGCHTTSMAGTWMSIVQGFGGMRIVNDKVVFNPFLPKEWRSYRFHIVFRDARLLIEVKQKEVCISHLTGPEVNLVLFNKEHQLKPNSSINESI